MPELDFATAVENFRKAIENGLLKIMSKMGISVLSSYRGGYNFEALGLSRSLVARYFPPMTSRISGLGLSGIESQLSRIHEDAWQDQMVVLPVGGFFRLRKSGESHAFDAEVIHSMQHACDTGSYDSWKNYTSKVYASGPVNLRDLLDFTDGHDAIDLDQVRALPRSGKACLAGDFPWCAQPRKSRNAVDCHEPIGAKSDSGEGGRIRDALCCVTTG